MQRTSMSARRLHPYRRSGRWGIALLGLAIPAGACSSVDASHQASAGATGSGGATPAAASSASVGGGGASASMSSGSGVVGPCAAKPWARDLGAGSSVSELHQALGADCSTILTGYFTGALDLGNGPLSANGDAKGFFVAKLDAAGHTLWSHAFEATMSVSSPVVAVDAQGDIVFGSSFSGTIDLGSGPLTSTATSDLFLAKLDSDGHTLWSRLYHLAADVGDIAMDAAGNVIIGGAFGGDMDFGLGVIHGSPGHLFLVKLDPTGKALWQTDIESPEYATVYGLAVDGTGAITFTGMFKTSIGFGFSTTAWRSSYVARYDTDGTFLWAHQLDGYHGERALAVAVDAAGNSVIGGSFSVPLDIGDPSVDLGLDPSMEGGIACAIRYDPKGKVTWGHCFYSFASINSPESDQRVNGIAFGPAGQLWMTGAFKNKIDFGGGPLINQTTGSQIFVAELDAAGKQLGAAQYGTSSGAPGYGSSGNGLVVDAAGRAHVIGTLTGSASFDGGPLKSSGDADGFVATVDF